MNLFKQRQPKRFSYTPRHLKEQKDSSNDFEPKWRRNTQRNQNMRTLPVLLIVLGMIIAIWYVLSNYEN